MAHLSFTLLSRLAPLDVFGLPYPDFSWLVGLHNLSDLLIGMCYSAIATTLIWLFYRGRRTIPFSWMFLAFGAFIVACGATHFMHVLTVWDQQYWWLLAITQAVTVAASLFSAVLLPPLVPKALGLVGAAQLSERRKAQLQTTNAELERKIVEHERVEAALRASEAGFRQLFADNPHPMWVFDSETLRFLEVNDAAVARYGYTRDEFLRLRLPDIRPAEDVPHLLAGIERVRQSTLSLGGEWRHRRKDGQIIDVEINSHALEFSGRAARLVVAQDISERKAIEAQLQHQAFHDPLTDLPNRALFLERLQHALARSTRRREAVAILFLDLDRFKVINDSLGHAAGDQLLVAVGSRLQQAVRPEDTVARLGGDEFTILLEEVADAREATSVAERVSAALQAPFTVEGREVFVTTSIGIVLSTVERNHPVDLMRDVDVALYRAKARGKGQYEVFDPRMNARALECLELESALRHALERGQFRVYYQPQVELATGRLAGLEALVRWEHPERGLIPPAEFIPLAEETGLIRPLGRWVLAEACRQARAWYEAHPSTPPLTICVNLSAGEFQHPDMVEEVATILRESGLDPRRLQLELTESAAMEDAEATIATLRKLKGLGVELAIDDFGTGYSSLAYLKRFPVDALKVDKSFVDGLGQNAEDTAIVQTVITLAHTLGLRVTAEGVETAAQLSRLRALGCEWGQGYFFARPLAPAAIDALLERGLSAVIVSADLADPMST